MFILFHLVCVAQASEKRRKEHQNEESTIITQIKPTNWANFGPTSIDQESQVNTIQGQGPSIKLRNKKEFGQLISSLETSNFNFYAFKLLLECD